MARKTTGMRFSSHYLGRKGLTFVSNRLTNLRITDMETCYKAFRAPILQHMPLSSRGFGMEVEITARLGHLPLRICEVPISYHGRTYEEGKKIGFTDGLEALWYLLYFNFIQPHKRIYKNYIQKIKEEIGLY